MTRVSRLVFLTLFALMVPLQAFAGKWVQKEIGWKLSQQGPGGTGTGIWVRDTTFLVLAGEVADTLGDFSLSDADIWFNHPGAATTVDTAYVAYVVLQGDSAVRGTETLASLTMEIDGRAGGFGTRVDLGSWQQVDSTVVTFVDSNPLNRVLTLPIRAISGLGGLGSNGPENALNYFYRLTAFETLRVRFSTATGLLSGSVRAFIRYWDDD